MGYMHIDNLYKNQDILMFRECYALEKVHGTSAHLRWKDGWLRFSPGGVSHDTFAAIFDESLVTRVKALGYEDVAIYGEAYGGKVQRMGHAYGKELRFIAFDVKVGDVWLSVPDMDQVATGLGLEVVPWRKVTTDLAALDWERDRPSEVAERRGCGVHPREGVVLRPLIEVRKNNDHRIIAKHKGAEFSERSTPQAVADPAKLQVIAEADAIAQEWVTPMRLEHVLQKMPGASIEQMRDIISAMVEDVYREGAGEIVESRSAAAAIGRRTAALFKVRLNEAMRDGR
jgi:hypothetical protein